MTTCFKFVVERAPSSSSAINRSGVPTPKSILQKELASTGQQQYNSTYFFLFRSFTCSGSLRCFANNLATSGFLTPSLGRPAFRDRHTSAARIPDAVIMMVCGAPGGFVGVAFRSPACFLRNAGSLSVTRGSVQLVLSFTLRATFCQYVLDEA